MRHDLALSDSFLNLPRQLLDQAQAPGYPAWTPTKTTAELLQTKTKTFLKLSEEPALFQGTLLLRPAQ